MMTFLLTFRLDEGTTAGRVNWWVHALVILGVPGADSGVEALPPGAVADHRVPEVAGARQRAEPRFREGAGRARDGEGSRQQDGARRVHLRRVRALPGELPGVGRRQGAEPEDAHPADAGGAAGRRARDASSARSTREKVLWQCTTCGACENQCPVGIEHLPLIDRRAARPGVERRRAGLSRRRCTTTSSAAATSGASATTSGRSSSSRRRSRPSIPPKHDVLVWLGCAGAFEADFQKSLRSLFEILRARSVTFGVLSKERCTGDPAKRTGNEYMFQELANANIEDLKAAGAEEDPDVVPALREDDRRRLPAVRLRGRGRPLVGLRRGADCATLRAGDGAGARRGHVPRSVLSRTLRRQGRRAARAADAVRRRHQGAGSATATTRSAAAPAAACCSPTRKRSRARASATCASSSCRTTGADTVVTACPFCSIMLKGAQASAPGADMQFVDLMTYVNGQTDEDRELASCPIESMHQCDERRSDWRASPSKRLQAQADLDALGYRADRGARLDAALAHRRARASRRDRRAAAASRSWRSGTAASCPPPTTSAAAASSSSPARTSTANGSPASSSGSATGRRAVRRRAARRKALLQLTRDMAAGKPAGFTVDGPRGPARVAQPGAVWLAKATGNPVLPFHLEADRHWTLNSWDRTQIPEAVRDRGDRDRRAVRRAADADDAGARGGARGRSKQRLQALEVRARAMLLKRLATAC